MGFIAVALIHALLSKSLFKRALKPGRGKSRKLDGAVRCQSLGNQLIQPVRRGAGTLPAATALVRSQASCARRRVQGDPRGPGGPPHKLCSISLLDQPGWRQLRDKNQQVVAVNHPLPIRIQVQMLETQLAQIE